jgi:hypothetical protein
MSISQSSNPTSETNGLSYARQLLGNSHVDDCLKQGKSYVCRLVQGAWFLHQTTEPANHYRAYRDILRFLQAQPEAQS